MKKKHTFSSKRFLGIWVPTLTLGLALAIGVPVAAYANKTVIDLYINRGSQIVTKAEGTDSWDGVYNKKETTTPEEAMEKSRQVTQQICEEGIVLLKNNNQALPLTGTTPIALMGRDAVDPIYGGSGSGAVDTSTCIDLRSGLENAGLTISKDPYNAFKRSSFSSYPRAKTAMDDYDSSLFFSGELPLSAYQNAFTPSSSETAVLLFGRGGGEGCDLSTNLKRDMQNSASQKLIASNAAAKAEYEQLSEGQHQLELSQNEKDLLSFAESHYQKTIVVLNCANIMEVGALKDDSKLDALIWMGLPGSTGFNALGNILAGKVNPSGRSVDTWARDFTADPTFPNFGWNGVDRYSDVSDVLTGNNGEKAAYFTEYEEGIYLGYRYYETRYQSDEAAYQQAVAYPFGYGLSYTSFSEKILSHQEKEGQCTLEVEVTNTGSVSGKDVIQVYGSAPYVAGGIAKASESLLAFSKSSLLAPNASEKLTLTFKSEDLASYDAKSVKGYVLEGGTYGISLKKNAHELIDSYSLNFERNEYPDGRDSDVTKATNHFDDVSGIFTTRGKAGYASLMNRDDFSGSFPTLPDDNDGKAANILIEGKSVQESLKPYQLTNNAQDVAPTMGESNGLGLIDLRGVGYDDPLWEKLLNQLNESDYQKASNYLIDNGYRTPEIASIAKPGSIEHDGTAGFRSGGEKHVAFMSEVVLAASYNLELAKTFAEALAEEALWGDETSSFAGIYAPGMNLHRSPFEGRIYEYYSEDPVLSGEMATAFVSAAANKGLRTFCKHFALNEQEYKREVSLCTWADEQTMRELYLKPYEMCVKNAKATEHYIANNKGEWGEKTFQATTSIMSSFNRIGTTWSGGSSALMSDVLRGEWGFQGAALSDFNLYGFMVPDQGMRAGTDMQLTWLTQKGSPFEDTTSATARKAIRQSIKNMSYSIVNSNAMNGIVPGTVITYTRSPWEYGIIFGDLAFSLLEAFGIVYVVFHLRKMKSAALS